MTKQRVLHISHALGGGTQKYIDELCLLYPKYQHTILSQLPFNIDVATLKQTKLVHIHASLIGIDIGWKILDIVRFIKQQNTIIYLTIHDYQWIFPNNPGITTEDILYGPPPKQENIANTLELFFSVDNIIVPSRRVFDNYQFFLKRMPDHSVVVPHNDIPIRYEQLFIAPVTDTINIAFVGYCVLHKGIRQLYQLASVFTHYYGRKITYHLYGGPSVLDFEHVVGHDVYNDKQLIQQLHNDNIHMVFMLSLSEETYCYSLSRVINSGLPIVYFNRGAFLIRMNPDTPRFFPSTNNIQDLQKQTIKAIDFIYRNQGQKDYTDMGEDPELNDWYRNNYLV